MLTDGTIPEAYTRKKDAKRFVNIANIVGNHRYNFVMLNSCNSAGGNPPLHAATIGGWDSNSGQPGAVNYNFARAFQVEPDIYYAGTFIGWNGAMGEPNFTAVGGKEPWLPWWEKWWELCSTGRTIQSWWNHPQLALAEPTSTTAPWKPKDANRAAFDGSPMETFLP